MACDAQTLINTAVSNGYNKLSDRDLLACLVAAACAITGGSGLPTPIGAVYKGTQAQRDATTPAVTGNQGALWVITDSVPSGIVSWWDGATWQ